MCIFPNDHVVLSCKTPHITHTTHDIQMYTLETVTSSDPIIICCRIAAKTGFILFCTWEKIVELNIRNQAHLFFFPLYFYKGRNTLWKVVSKEAQEVLVYMDLKQLSSDPQAFKFFSTLIYYRLNIDKSREPQINTVCFSQEKCISNNSNFSAQ